MKWDVWAQRLVAVAILIAAISLLIGTGSYAYKEVSSLKGTPAFNQGTRR